MSKAGKIDPYAPYNEWERLMGLATGNDSVLSDWWKQLESFERAILYVGMLKHKLLAQRWDGEGFQGFHWEKVKKE